jgi:hypothetical protein
MRRAARGRMVLIPIGMSERSCPLLIEVGEGSGAFSDGEPMVACRGSLQAFRQVRDLDGKDMFALFDVV